MYVTHGDGPNALYNKLVLIPNRVLLTATADIDTPTGIQVLQFVPLMPVQGIPLLQYMQYIDPDTRCLIFAWCAPFRAVPQLSVQQGLARVLTTMLSKF